MHIHRSCFSLATSGHCSLVMLMQSWAQPAPTLEYRYPPSLSGLLSLFQSSSVYSFPFCGPASFLATAGHHESDISHHYVHKLNSFPCALHAKVAT